MFVCAAGGVNTRPRVKHKSCHDFCQPSNIPPLLLCCKRERMTIHINMPESGFATETQRLRRVNGGKAAESGRWCRCSPRRCVFFILVLGTVLLWFSTNMTECSRQWWTQYNTTKWWISFGGLDVPKARVLHAGTETTSTNASVLYKSPGPYVVEYPHEYGFIINEPNTCKEQNPFLVLVVPVAPHNRASRDVIRSTWGGENPVLDKTVTLFFLLGRHDGDGAEQLQERLLKESEEHRDLIQSDFLDCYKNLTIKTMVMLEWLDSHCSGASYAMKIDSDVFLNLPKLIDMLLKAPEMNYMTGLVERGAMVLRDPNSKWYVPVELYPHAQYPLYALGLGYVLSLDLPKRLVEASRHVRALYIEDVYLGLCMQHLGILPTDPPQWGYFNVFPVPYSRCAYSRLVATTMFEHADLVWTWKDFKKPGPYC